MGRVDLFKQGLGDQTASNHGPKGPMTVPEWKSDLTKTYMVLGCWGDLVSMPRMEDMGLYEDTEWRY